MNRLRATFGFVTCGGLLLFLAPYLIYEAAMKDLPRSVLIIAIPFYAVLSYGAFKVFWSCIIGKARTTPSEKDETLAKTGPSSHST